MIDKNQVKRTGAVEEYVVSFNKIIKIIKVFTIVDIYGTIL